MQTKDIAPMTSSSALLDHAKWGWACRSLLRCPTFSVAAMPTRPGDVVVARVVGIRNHSSIVDVNGARTSIYPGDVIVGVLGHRYATDAFHAFAWLEGTKGDLLTNAGMIGRVRSRHADVKGPTRLEVLGALVDAEGTILNLVDRLFHARPAAVAAPDVLLVVGTGMNAGKTTTATQVCRGALAEGLSVAAIKVTGSVSPNDRSELAATGVGYVADFSDYGFPSTHLLSPERLAALAATMIEDARVEQPDVIVVEIADGVLQRETEILLRESSLRAQTLGVVLAAPCALSAWKGAEVIASHGHRLLGVSGIISNAPLFVAELKEKAGLEVYSSRDGGRALGRLVASTFAQAPRLRMGQAA